MSQLTTGFSTNSAWDNAANTAFHNLFSSALAPGHELLAPHSFEISTGCFSSTPAIDIAFAAEPTRFLQSISLSPRLVSPLFAASATAATRKKTKKSGASKAGSPPAGGGDGSDGGKKPPPVEYAPSDLPDDQLERLQNQIREIDELLGTNIVPESMMDEIMDLPLSEIKQIFRTRFSAFVQALSANKGSKESKERVEKIAGYIAALNSLDQYISSYSEDEAARTLRPHQFESFKKLRDFLEAGNRAGYFKLPTGYGKTVLFIEFLEALNLKTLIVAPTQPLVEQTQQKFGEFADEVDIGLVYAWAKDFDKEVTITTYDSFVAKVNNGEVKPQDYDCLILDEAHKSLSDVRMGTVRKFKHALRLGFTATPYFSEEKNVAQLLPNEIDRLDIKDAIIDEGMLSSVRVILAQTDLDLAEVGGSGEDYNKGDLARRVDIEERNQAAVEYYQKYFSDSTVICYCAGVRHAKNVADLFNAAGVPAAAISGYMSPPEKQRILKAHHSGKIKVVCNADILVEGYDEPSVDLCINLRPTFSWVFAEQRGGRAVRLDPNNSDKVATILDFIDKNSNALPFTHPISFAEVLGQAHALNRQHQEEGVTIEEMEDDVMHGVRFITDPNKIMEVLGSRPIRVKRLVDEEYKEQEREMLEQGWLSVATIADELDINTSKAGRLGKAAAQSNPSLMTTLERKRERGRPAKVPFFRPEILPLLEEEIEQNTAPAGWLTKTGLRRRYALTDYEINLYLKTHKLAKKGSPYYGKFLFPDERSKSYFAPKLGEMMVIEMHRGIPTGWESLRALARRTGIARYKLSPIAEQVLEACDEREKVVIRAKREGEKRDLYYDPEVIEEILRCALEQSERHVESRQVAGAYKTSLSRVRDALSLARLSKPVVEVRDRNKRKKLQYILSKDVYRLRGFLMLNRDWKSLNDVAAQLKVHVRFVRRVFDQIKSRIEKKYHVFMSQSAEGVSICISPEFVQEIKKETDALKYKRGWKTSRQITWDVGISRNSVRVLLREAGGGTAERQTFINQRGHMKPYYPPRAVRYVEKKAQAIKRWPTAGQLAKEFNEPEPRIRYLAIGYQIKNPDRLAVVRSNRKIHIDPAAIDYIREQLSETDGWLDSTALLANSEIGYDRLLKMLQELQEERPELFRWGVGAHGQNTMRIHPEVIALINARYDELAEWISEDDLAEDLGLLRPELDILKEYCVGNDADQVLPLYKGKRVARTLIGPALEARIRECADAPDGWMTLVAIVDEYDLDRDQVEPFMAQFKTRHPEKVKTCWHPVGKKLCDFFDPSVIEAIETNMVARAPRGWKTATEIMDQYGIDDIQLDGILSALISRDRESELTKQYRASSGTIDLHYHPDVVSKIASKLPPPDGWLSFVQLAQECDTHPRRVKQLADQLSVDNPQWQQKFFDMDAGHERTFLHPELVDMIDQVL